MYLYSIMLKKKNYSILHYLFIIFLVTLTGYIVIVKSMWQL